MTAGRSMLEGWGRTIRVAADEVASEDLAAITTDAVLTRGLGRSYGDASLPPAPGMRVAASRLADRWLDFDPASGSLRAEAGLSLAALHRAVLPRGWFTPVSPGTEWVTLGGMVAADVHGKNHHLRGSFGAHVQRIKLRTGQGRILECGPEEERELWRATIGGMGLTGHLLEVTFRMERIPSPWIWQRVIRVESFDGLVERLRACSPDWPFTVAWSDLLLRGKRRGRGVVILGRWAEPGEAPGPPRTARRGLELTFNLPDFVLNPLAVSWFNRLQFVRHREFEGPVDPAGFFYPLDALGGWNRAYGRRGFTQYQFVVPREGGDAAARRLVDLAVEAGGTPYLAVVKDFGAEGPGMISFPRAGLTVALDLPWRGAATQALIDRLNEALIDAGGRIYLAKDGHTRAEHFRAMEPRLPEWNRVRRQWDPESRLQSALGARLLGPAA